MAETVNDPPAKKVGPEEIDAVLDDRGELGFSALTAAQIAHVIARRSDEFDDLNPETVRNHLNAMVDSDEWDVAKYKHGPRTVLYGRPEDPKKVVADGGGPVGVLLKQFQELGVFKTSLKKMKENPRYVLKKALKWGFLGIPAAAVTSPFAMSTSAFLLWAVVGYFLFALAFTFYIPVVYSTLYVSVWVILAQAEWLLAGGDARSTIGQEVNSQ